MDTLYTKRQVADRYHVTTRTIDRWIRQFGIVSASPGSKFLFRESDLVRMEPDQALSDSEREEIVENLIGG